jgi:hypothetical protein
VVGPTVRAASAHADNTATCPRARVRGTKTKLNRQVFWLTARSDPRATFPRDGSSRLQSGIRLEFLADHSSGPAPDSHRLPSSSHPFARVEPVEIINILLQSGRKDQAKQFGYDTFVRKHHGASIRLR